MTLIPHRLAVMDVDLEALNDFLEEGCDLLDQLEMLFIELENNNNDKDVLVNIFRAVHTIKGSSSFLGFKNLETFCHAAEELLDKARNGELDVSSDHVSLLLAVMDILRYCIKVIEVKQWEPEEDFSAIINQLKAANAGEAFDPNAIDMSRWTSDLQMDNIESAGASIDSEAETPAEEKAGLSEDATAVDPVESEINAQESIENPPNPEETGAEASSQENGSDTISEEILNVADDSLPDPEPVLADDDTWAEIEDDEEEENEASPTIISEVNDTIPEKPLPQLEEISFQQNNETTPAKSTNVKSIDNTVRIDVKLLDSLMNMVGELVLARNQLLQQLNEVDHSGTQSTANSISLITTELQDGIMKTRMQPIGNVLNKFIRVVRDLSKSLGKETELIISGKETELDRTLMEAIRDPLTHIIRNAIDHGIESPEEREALNKPREGHLWINSYHEGGHIVIEIKDDGRGLNKSKIIDKIVDNGLATPELVEKMDDNEIYNHIFEPGFSTVGEVSKLSGRGVGMDVVKSSISKIGGAVDLQSQKNEGTTLFLRIPLTLAIIPALIVKSHQDSYAIPQVSLIELILLKEEEKDMVESLEGTEVYRLRGKLLPLVRLSTLLGRESSEKNDSYIIVLANGANNFGLVVDDVEDSGEIVVKPLSPHFKSCEIFAGATLMGNGNISLILDVAAIAQSVNLDSRDTRSLADKLRSRTKNANTVLTFHVGGPERFGVQLSHVARLEDFSASDIEFVGNRKTMCYRGKILPLINLSDVLNIDEVTEGMNLNLIVFKAFGREAGLIVSEITDTVELEGDLNSDVYDSSAVLGTMILKKDVTLILDLLKIFEYSFPEIATNSVKQLNINNDRKIKTLHVEDSAFYRKIVKHYLDPEFFELVSAENGQVGLDKIDQEPFDLLIIDLEMPVMDGYSLLKEIRKKSNYNRVPVMVMTALTSSHDKSDAIKSGIQSFIIKLDKEEFLSEITRILNLRKEAV